MSAGMCVFCSESVRKGFVYMEIEGNIQSIESTVFVKNVYTF